MLQILNNPYRTIGILVGSSAREQDRQIKRLKQLIDADQIPDDDFVFPSLGELHRTIESVNDAAQKLNLDSDKMFAALFWFYNGNAISDEAALDSLKKADQQNAIEIWTKLTAAGELTERNCSAFHNLSTLLLCNAFINSKINPSLLEKGIDLKLKVLESDYVKDLRALATDKTFKTTKKELQLLFLNQVLFEIDKNGRFESNKFVGILNSQEFSAKKDFFKVLIEKNIEQIEKKINEAQTKRKSNIANAFNVGRDLFNQTSKSLIELKSILGITNIRFSSISDKVGDEILQCGIDHFNHFKDTVTDPSKIAIDLFSITKILAMGDLAKQRCQENIEYLQNWIENKPERDIRQKAENEVNFIIKQLNLASETLKNNGKYPKGYNDPYSKLPINEQPHNKISPLFFDDSSTINLAELVARSNRFSPNKSEPVYNINLFRLSRDIVQDCKPKLLRIKEVVGSDNEVYKKLSNDLASIALACLIDYVNYSRDTLTNVPQVGEHTVNAMNAIGELDMNSEIRIRYNNQKQSLNNIKRAISQRYTKKSGCYIATMVYGDYNHPQVVILRHFRDNVLTKSQNGIWFIETYYQYSPKLVKKLENKKAINFIIRSILDLFIKLLKLNNLSSKQVY